MSKDLLIYTTVANRDDNIKFSVLIDPEKKTASFPSVTIEENKQEKWYVDNNLFIIRELLPALKAFDNAGTGPITPEQAELIKNIPLPDMRWQSVAELIDILEYAIANNLLTETM